MAEKLLAAVLINRRRKRRLQIAMELGCFDDSLFSESRSREPANLTSYNAKICVPKWFHGAESSDDQEQINLEKYNADYHYHMKKYTEALDHYKKCLGLLPKSNMSMRRDILESISRCYLALGLLDDAVLIAEDMYHAAQNFEQKTNTLRLLVDVYHSREDLMAEALALERYIFLHPFHADLWLSLAKVYSRLDQHASVQECLHLFPCEQESCVLTCCLRSQALLEYASRTSQGFPKEVILKQMEEVSDMLKAGSHSNDFIRLCKQAVCKDLRGSSDSESSDSVVKSGPDFKPEQIVSLSDQEVHRQFVEEWFSWSVGVV